MVKTSIDQRPCVRRSATPRLSCKYQKQTQAPLLSLVVLPFENLGGNPQDKYLADGITDDLTTDLSPYPGRVRDHRYPTPTRAKPGRCRPEVGRELGVRYAIEGSMRKLGDVLPVNAQLVATQTGARLWADRFDMQLKELSAGQGDIARRIAQTLNVAVMDIESARSKLEHPTDPNAFDLILRARSMYLHPMGVRGDAERLALSRAGPAARCCVRSRAHRCCQRTDPANLHHHAANELERAGALIRKAAAMGSDCRVDLAVLDPTATCCSPGPFSVRRWLPIGVSWKNISTHAIYLESDWLLSDRHGPRRRSRPHDRHGYPP